MTCKLYVRLYHILTARGLGARRPHQTYSDRIVLLVYFWAVVMDRPVSWACDSGHRCSFWTFQTPSEAVF